MSPCTNTVGDEIANDSVMRMLRNKINAASLEGNEDAFFVGDVSDMVAKYDLWNQQLPRVHPHYAVKCNEDPVVLSTLARLGTGFDCASKAEIQKVLSLKVAPSSIIYANPCKQTSHIKYAVKHGVRMMTFDNEHELQKMAAICPDAQLVLRILPPDGTKGCSCDFGCDEAQCQLGMKYGAHPDHVPALLATARGLGLHVMGVSFHVGSGCYDAGAFAAAVVAARRAFDEAALQGFRMTLLDIGGGFPGQDDAKISFEGICELLRPALDTYFSPEDGVRIIAEPGRFFVASAFTLAVNVIAKRTVPAHAVTSSAEPAFMYYVNDGVYGSFNCLLYDHAEVTPSLAREQPAAPRHVSSVWGPTCDGLDCLLEATVLPELDVGDWLLFRNMGAYTMCAGSSFNGMPRPGLVYTGWPTDAGCERHEVTTRTCAPRLDKTGIARAPIAQEA